MTYTDEVKTIDLQAADERLRKEMEAAEPNDPLDIPYEEVQDEVE